MKAVAPEFKLVQKDVPCPYAAILVAIIVFAGGILGLMLFSCFR